MLKLPPIFYVQPRATPLLFFVDAPFSRTFEHTKTYAEGCVEVAKDQKVAYVNLFNAMSEQEVG